MSRRGSQQGGNLYVGEGNGNKHIKVARDKHRPAAVLLLHHTYLELLLVYLRITIHQPGLRWENQVTLKL